MGPELRQLARTMNQERAGRRMYATLGEYPERLLRQLEVLGGEVDRLQLELAKSKTKGQRRG